MDDRDLFSALKALLSLGALNKTTRLGTGAVKIPVSEQQSA